MRAGFGRALPVGLLILVSACAGRTPDPAVVYREVPVAVSVGCVVDRPVAVTPLNQQVAAEQWNALAPGAKAEAVRAQAGDRMNYEDRLNAATSGCKKAEPAP